MTDAVAAPGLTDVWNLSLSVLERQPIPLRVLIVLGVLVVLIMVIDGVRANLKRQKPQSLHIVREAYGPSRASQVFAAREGGKAQATRGFQPKRVMRKSSHKTSRPAINRNPFEEQPLPPAYQPNRWEPPQE